MFFGYYKSYRCLHAETWDYSAYNLYIEVYNYEVKILVSAPTVKIIDYDEFNSVILTLCLLFKILEESLLCHNSDFSLYVQKTWQARFKFLQIDESDQKNG